MVLHPVKMQAGDKIGVSAPISIQSLVYNGLFWLFMVCRFFPNFNNQACLRSMSLIKFFYNPINVLPNLNPSGLLSWSSWVILASRIDLSKGLA